MNSKHEPIRCFEGNGRPHEPFWNIRNAADAENEEGEPEIELYGYISEYSWWEDDVTPAMFKKDLYDAGKGGPVTVRINSYGGDIIAASMMNIMLRDYPGRVTVQIDGVAASAATMVAMAGDVIKIQDIGYFMIHDPAYGICGYLNIEIMEELLDSLKAFKEGIINAYEVKTGLSRTRLGKLMTDETWMDAQKALDLGFVDDILHKEAKENVLFALPENVAAAVNALQSFEHVPEPILRALQPSDSQEEVVETCEPLLTDDQRREAEDLREEVNQILQNRKE